MDEFLFDPKFHRFSDFLDIDKYRRDEPLMAHKIAYLYDWSEMKAKSENFIDVLNSITKLRKDMGTTMRGEELVRDLYRWVRLDTETDKMIQQKKVELEKIKEAKLAKEQVKERVIKRAKDWEDKKTAETKLSQDKEKASQQYANKTIKESIKNRQQLKSSNMEVKDIKSKPLESEEVKWD